MVEVHVAETAAEREDAIAIRKTVFIEEQDVPEHLELDGRDQECLHFVAYDGDDPVGAARLRPLEDTGDAGVTTAKVERVAVLEGRREEGIGEATMATLESTARRRGFEQLILHAQTHVEGFYSRLGYETTSDVFEEAGIPHVEMEKSLVPPS
jgi:predicted GNAT family N-acyltransferase